MNLWHFVAFFCVELVAAVPYLADMRKNRKKLQDSKTGDFALFLLTSSAVVAVVTLPNPTTADLTFVVTNGLAGGIIALILRQRRGYVWDPA